MAARTSVIIATYNWSQALKTSIASVLEQSDADFELLVIGDCCTDDSERIVASFRDARLRWHNLPVRAGSQSGPNNYGLSIASGQLIAYLGHDDLWHPDHLRTLVETQQRSGADIVCSAAVMYGPPGSGVRAITGIFVEGTYRPDDFLPPSSLLHVRSLTDRIGLWANPEQTADPVDCDLLRRAHAAGARIVSTEHLTAFKFNSAWRRDSYLRRETTEQQEILTRLREHPARTVSEELVSVVRAGREKRLIEMQMPAGGAQPPGGRYRANLTNRGLADIPATPLIQVQRYSLDEHSSALDWHLVEHHPDWGTFRWSGPSPVTTIVLPVNTTSSFRICIQMLNWLQVDVASEVTISVGGRPLDTTCQTDGIAMRFEADAPPQDGPLRIQLRVSQMRCPYFLTNRSSPDHRWIGVCVNWVELRPLPTGGVCP